MPGSRLPLRCRASALALVSAVILACPAPALAGGLTGSAVVQPGTDTNSAGRAEAFVQTASASGAINRLNVYFDGASTASAVAVGLYTDASSRPGRQLASCTVSQPRPGAWNSCRVTAVDVTSGRRYWAAILQPTRSTGGIRFRDVLSGGAPSYSSRSRSLGSLPTTFRVGQSGSSSPASIFADEASVPPPPVPPPGLSLQQVDGGPAYYGQFSNPLPTSPDFFPIGVWGSYNHTPANVAIDKARGINTYVWLADAGTSGMLANVRAAGMWALPEGNTGRNMWGSETVGRLTQDELDMRCGPPGCDGYTQLEDQIRNLGCVIRCSDGRMLYANYGKGVLFWESEADAARWINGTPSFGRYQDFVSTDLYWFTDPNERSKSGEHWLPEGQGTQMNRSQVERASNYGYQIDYLRKLDAMDGKRQPIWNFVEVGCPWSECGADPDFIKPAEIRAAVWHSIIAGARGIIYFQHTFGGPSGCLSHYALREPLACYSQVQSAVTALNAQVKLLAPMLNAPTVVSGTTSTPSIRSMVKWHNGHFYIFAGSRNNQSSTGTISIPCVGNATAARLGESGSVSISGGSFSDQFADGNAVHIYRVDGGSTCGLG